MACVPLFYHYLLGQELEFLECQNILSLSMYVFVKIILHYYNDDSRRPDSTP